MPFNNEDYISMQNRVRSILVQQYERPKISPVELDMFKDLTPIFMEAIAGYMLLTEANLRQTELRLGIRVEQTDKFLLDFNLIGAVWGSVVANGGFLAGLRFVKEHGLPVWAEEL